MKKRIIWLFMITIAFGLNTTNSSAIVTYSSSDSENNNAFFIFDKGINEGSIIGDYEETWNSAHDRVSVRLPNLTSVDGRLSFIGWINSENRIYRAGSVVYGTITPEKRNEIYEALWSSEENENLKTVKEIRVTWESLPKDGSDAHNLLCGSKMGIMAIVILEDGTVAVGDKKNVDWEIVNKEGSDTNARCTVTENANMKECPCVTLYAPFGFEERLIVEATSKDNNFIKGEYEVNTTKQVITGEHVYSSGKSYYRFNPYAPNGFDVLGEDPVFDESWDAKEGTYTVIIPECNYKIDELEFSGWYSELTKQFYKPLEKLTIKVGDYSSVWFPLYSMWRDPNPPEPPRKVTIKEAKRKKRGNIAIKWNKVSKASGYQIAYSTKRSFEKERIKTVKGSKRNYTIKGLKNNKTYYIRVRAFVYDKTNTLIYGRYGKAKRIK